MKSAFLQPILDSGSSRIFHILYHTQRLAQQTVQGGAPPRRLFFNARAANNILIIKSPLSSHDPAAKRDDKPVRTKLFFPFNERNLYEGGKTILLGDPNLAPVLEEHWALTPQRSADDFNHDMRALNVLDDLPTLDPFLMRDKFEIERIDVNPDYFDVAPDELAGIQSFIRDKMNVIAEFALGNSGDGKAQIAVSQLTEKLWEAKDLQALGPVIGSLRLPAESALESIYAWKGLIFYDYEMTRQHDDWRQLAEWLSHATETRDGATRRQMIDLRQMRDEAGMGMKKSYQIVRRELGNYKRAFERLFVKKESPEEFVQLLKNSRKIFWLVGDHMSRIGHCVAIWDQISSRYPRRLLPYDSQLTLIDAMSKIFRHT